VRFAAVPWPTVAEALGYPLGRTGERVRNGFALRFERGWLALVERKRPAGDPLRAALGAPGLWRGLRDGRGWNFVFDIPPLVAAEGEGGSVEEQPFAVLLDWAAATAGGTLAGGATPPPREELESWAPPARRSVRAGAHIAQVDVVAEPTRLALVIPALVRIPAGVSPARVAWLGELCHDAQDRWRMVRFGIDDEAACVRAEVDLTGAPADRLQPLFELALAALTWSAERVLPALALVTDPGVESQALDRHPSWPASRGGPRPEVGRVPPHPETTVKTPSL
jgi:hypothetical protein